MHAKVIVRFVTVMVVVSLSLPSWAAVAAQSPVKAPCRRGDIALEVRDYLDEVNQLITKESIDDGDLETALENLVYAREIFQQVEQPCSEGYVLSHIGQIYKRQERYGLAARAFEDAVAVAAGLDAPFWLSFAYNSLGEAYRIQGRASDALAAYKRALETLDPTAEEAQVSKAATLNNIGILQTQMAEFDAALENFEAALLLVDDRPLKQAEIFQNQAETYRNQGRYEEAEAVLSKALDLVQSLEDQPGRETKETEALLLNSIGLVQDGRGLHEKALNSYERMLAISRSIGNKQGVASALHNMASAYRQLGDYAKALTYFEQAQPIFRNLGLLREQAEVLNGAGVVLSALGKHDKALENYREALKIQDTVGDRGAAATTHHNIAMAFREQGKNNEAQDELVLSLKQFQAIGDQEGQGKVLTARGSLLRREGKYPEALADYRQALRIQEGIGDLEGLRTTYHNIGVLYESQDAIDRAILGYQQAITVTESILGAIHVEDVTAKFVGSQDYVDSYARLIALLWSKGRYNEAFAYAERVKARAFLNRVGSEHIDFRHGPDPSGLIDQEQQLRQHILGFQSRLVEKDLTTKDRDKLGDELDQARKDYAALLIRLKLNQPEYAELVTVRTRPIGEVQSLLKQEDITLIEYFVLDDQTLVWVIDGSTVKPIALPVTRSALNDKVIEGMLKPIKVRDSNKQTATDLFDKLFRPVRPYIRHSTVVIVPHDVLHYLPFAALWDEQAKHYLIEDYPLAFVPSASTLGFFLKNRNPNRGTLLVMGNPSSTLPSAKDEAVAIAELYGTEAKLRQDATESQLYAQAGKTDVIHLAAHGVYDEKNPLFTRIELASDKAQDGNLEVLEVYELNMSGVNLVVLSACDTAGGIASVTRGDDIVSFTRAFLNAKVPAVVTTLWSVPDESTRELMVAFHRSLRQGISTAQAMRTAQSAMASRGEPPYHWAGFVLTGDYLGDGKPTAFPVSPQRSAQPR